MYTENDLITFGKYKFTAIKRVPAQYLISIHKMASVPDKQLLEWIDNNIEKLKTADNMHAEPPIVVMPCDKYCYLTEKEAKKELARIATTPSKKKPIRAYYCEKCGAYHLTSKPQP